MLTDLWQRLAGQAEALEPMSDDKAKANFDGVIAGLITALTEGGAPKSLPSLEAELGHGATSLGNFCKMVSDLVLKTSGRKDVVADIANAAVEPLIKALSKEVARYLQQLSKRPSSHP